MIDIHSHLIPGIDDGAASLEEALAAVAEMERDGITRIVTTPHLTVSLLRRPAAFAEYMERMDSAWAGLLQATRERFPRIELARGVELALDALPPSMTDERLFLAGTRFMLVEFPHFRVPPNSEYAIRGLVADGVFPILAHPERYDTLGADLEVVRAWRECGASTQVNSGSLTGRYGERPRQQAESMIAQGLADYLSSDYHARGSCTMLSAVRLLSSRGMAQQALALTDTNAARMLAGKVPGAVSGSGAPHEGFVGNLVRRLRRR